MNEWQYLDPECKLVYPWYTKSFLDVLTTWKTSSSGQPSISPIATPISSWNVFEWGGGMSTIWWSRHCKSITSIDHSEPWLKIISDEFNRIALSNSDIKFHSKVDTKSSNTKNHTLKYRIPSPNSGIGTTDEKSAYVQGINETPEKYDCVIIDGEYGRNTCAKVLMEKNSKGELLHLNIPSIIILDNADQQTVGLSSKETFELLKDYKHFIYREMKHPDWRTDYWIIDH